MTFYSQCKSSSLSVKALSNVLASSLPTGSAVSLSLSATCANCSLTGTGTATTTGFTKNATLLENVIEATKELEKNPEQFLADALGMNIMVDLENLSGHFQFGISFGAGGSITIPLLPPSITPLGGQVSYNSTIISTHADLE